MMAEVRTIPVSDRGQLESLLDERSAADALAAYYALEHPRERVRLFGFASGSGESRGFMAVAQTGLDLFLPLLVPFVGSRDVLLRLLHDAIRPGQAFLMHLPADQVTWLRGEVQIQSEQKSELLRLDSGSYEPVLNVLVVEAEGPDGGVRYEIQTADGIRAAAGLNWSGERFAEIYLDAEDEARGRSLTKSVLSALIARLLGEKKIPLYRVATRRISVKTEAFHLGFRPTGIKTSLIEGQLLTPDDNG